MNRERCIPLASMLLVSLSVAAAAEPLSLRVAPQVMKLRADDERKLTSVAGLSQELVAGKLPELRVLYGEIHLRVGWPMRRPQDTALPPSFGRITPGASQATLRRQSTTWVCNQLTYDCGRDSNGQDVTMELYVSRLSPAIIARTSSDSLVVLTGTAKGDLPDLLAAGGADGVMRRKGAAGKLPDGSRWVLLWRGKRTRAFGQGDLPLLIVPLSPLLGIEQGPSGGLRLRFEGKAAAALLPVTGIDRPDVAQTANWVAQGLPKQLKQACDFWARYAPAFPVDAVESFRYDEQTDTAETTVEVRFLKVREDAASAVPVPPMLALADSQGFGKDGSALKLTFSAKPTATGLNTIFGPLIVIEGSSKFTWSVNGLRRYVDFSRLAAPATEASRPFDERLASEVRKVVAAGMPAPWFYQDGCFRERLIERQLYWSDPAEHTYYMCEFIDLLSDEDRQALAEHLLACPQPETTAYISPKTGARREFYYVKPEFLDLRLRYESPPPKMPPSFNLYALSRLVASTGRKVDDKAWASCRDILEHHLKGRDWPTLFYFPGYGEDYSGVVAANRNFAGLIGAARLARLRGDGEALSVAMGRLASGAALRYAMGRYRRWLYDVGAIHMPPEPDWQARQKPDWAYGHLISFNCTRPDQDIQQVAVLDPFQVQTGTYHPIGDWRVAMRPYQIPFRFMAPETALFLADHLAPECRRYVDVVAEYQPDWYLTWAEATLGTEHNANHPVDAHQNFLARAWIVREPGEKLRKYIDVPYLARADYFYMHRLAETARALRLRSGQALRRKQQ